MKISFTCPESFCDWLKLTEACAGVFGNSVVQYAENNSTINEFKCGKLLSSTLTNTVGQGSCIIVLPGDRG